MSKKQIVLVLLLALVQFTTIVDFMIVMPLAPKLKTLWHIDSTQFSRLVSFFSIGAFISAMACMPIVDRYDRKKILLAVYSGFTIGTFFCGLSNTYAQLLLARFVTGLFGGIGGSIILSIVGDAVPAQNRGHAMGILMIGFSLASILGVPGGLWLAGRYEWHTPFIVLACVCTLVFFAALFILPSFTSHIKKLEPISNTLQLLQKIFANRTMRTALLLGVVTIMSHFSIIPFISDFFVNNLGFDFKSTVPFIYVTGGIITVMSNPIIGKLSDKYGRLIIFSVLTVLSLIPLLTLPNLNTTSISLLLLASSSLFIFSGSRMIICSAEITSNVQAEQRGAFMIVNSSLQQLAIGAVGAIGGAIITNDAQMRLQHYPVLGLLGAVLSFVALFIFRRLKQLHSSHN